MLTKRIIPCLDVDRGRVVKGVHFLQLRDAGDPVEVARRYEADGADELVFLDISASHEGRDILLDVVRRVSEELFMPFTVGGGIRSLDDATRLIQAGAEKVSINSAAVRDPGLVTQVARKFGSCATVVNIDPKRVVRDGREVWEVHVRGGREPTGLEAVAWAKRVEEDRETLFRRDLREQAHARAAHEQAGIIQRGPRDAQQLIALEQAAERSQRGRSRLGAWIIADCFQESVAALRALQRA